MQAFQIGFLSFATPVAMCIAYLLGRLLRHSAAWANNTGRPKERVIVYLILIAIVGFICGSGLQPFLTKGMQCASDGLPIVACMMPFGQ